jgi:hypothetical protein
MPGQVGVGCPSFGGQRTAAAYRAIQRSRAVCTLRMNSEFHMQASHVSAMPHSGHQVESQAQSAELT